MDVASRAGGRAWPRRAPGGASGVPAAATRARRPQPLLPHAVEIHPDRSGGVRAPRSVYVHWTGPRVHWTEV